MTNQEQYDDIWKSANKVSKMSEELKALEEKLDRTEKQRNALIIALNYVNETMVSMKWGAKARPKDMENIVKNALLMAVDNSEGTINLEVKEDDN